MQTAYAPSPELTYTPHQQESTDRVVGRAPVRTPGAIAVAMAAQVGDPGVLATAHQVHANEVTYHPNSPAAIQARADAALLRNHLEGAAHFEGYDHGIPVRVPQPPQPAVHPERAFDRSLGGYLPARQRFLGKVAIPHIPAQRTPHSR